MALDERKFRILEAIIDDYIMNAAPVGSRTISRKSGFGFSPATIRNEMSDLTELGYLAQPHTSAGRAPTAKAYRLYVDRLLKVNELSTEEAGRISSYLSNRAGQMEEVMKRVAETLSDITHYTAVVMAPQAETLRIRRVQLVPLSETSALAVVVTTSGIVRDAVIRVPEGLSPDHLYEISRMLTEQLNGLSLSQVRQKFALMFRDLKENRRLLAGVLDAMETRLSENPRRDVVVGGSANLLDYPEYSDINKVQSFLSVLESREKLTEILKQAGGVEMTIRIGPENAAPELQECSLITATYRVGDHATGTMGIIGPTRMNYGRVLAVLSYMGRAMSDLLSEGK